MKNPTFIHRYLKGANADSPVLFLLHGTGGNEEDLIPLGQQLFPGAAILSLRGRVSENGMPRFFRRFGEGRFDAKPNQAVIDKVKEAGYRWNPSDRIWVHPVRAESAMGTRIDAEKLYQEVRQMIRQEKGIEATKDIPF